MTAMTATSEPPATAALENGLDHPAVDDLVTYHRNPRRGNIPVIAESLTRNGQYRPIVVNRGTRTGRPSEVLAGNHTLLAARMLGWSSVAAVWVDVDERAAARIVAADNRTADLGDYEDQALLDLLVELPDLDGTGYTPDDLAELEKALVADTPNADPSSGQPLAARFLVPPMSVLDARRGWWQARKKEWLSIGLRPETGRDGTTIGGWAAGGLVGKNGATLGASDGLRGLSVFDPVLCEVTYRWWCPPGGSIVDPFAGGSVRGVVAGYLGHPYHGVDLRREQVDDNMLQVGLVPDDRPAPTWHVGDATALDDIDGLPAADLVFSCPPYADLERYSDDPRDLSTMGYPEFRDMHAKAIRLACDRLKDDAFAVWVIGEVRGKDGGFYGLVADTVDAFHAAGLQFATEAVLVTMIGTGAMRSARDFTGGRTLTRTHQNVLVFCKGNRRRATAKLGDVDLDDALAEYQEHYEDVEEAREV